MLKQKGCPLTRRFGKDVAIMISKMLWDWKMQDVRLFDSLSNANHVLDCR